MLKLVVLYFTLFLFCNVFLLTKGLSVAISDMSDLATSRQSSLVLDDKEISDALLFSDVSIGIVEDYIHYKLPPEATPEGEIILKNFKQNLIHCESYIHSVANIWKYKQCASGLVRDAMASLAGLQQTYRPYASSASRLTLLW